MGDMLSGLFYQLLNYSSSDDHEPFSAFIGSSSPVARLAEVSGLP
jgi:hypothetical protein